MLTEMVEKALKGDIILFRRGKHPRIGKVLSSGREGSKNIKIDVIGMGSNTKIPVQEQLYQVTALVTKDIYDEILASNDNVEE